MAHYNVFDVCAQIRQDWADTRMDQAAGPSKKCPGGYSIPANKECGGAKEDQPQPGQRGYKRSAAKRILKGAAKGALEGANAGFYQGATGEIVKGSVMNAVSAGSGGTANQIAANAGKRARSGYQVGAVVGGLAGGIGTAAKEVSAYRNTMKARKAAKQSSPQ